MKRRWTLKEFVNANTNGDIAKNPLQLFSHNAKPLDYGVWFITGFRGESSPECSVGNLIMRAVENRVFRPAMDLHVTPFANPAGVGLDTKTLSRWLTSVAPRLVVTFSRGPSAVRHMNVPETMIDKIKELSEKPIFELGTEDKQLVDGQGDVVGPFDYDHNFSSICRSHEVSWIDFSINSDANHYTEIRDREWRSLVGPTLKWLVEDDRFAPPKEEPQFQHEVIPPIELPPEFAL